MPISGNGWELHMVRTVVHRRASDGKRRTVGHYQIYHDGEAQTGPDMAGMFAESRGPSANSPNGNGRRIEKGTYTLRTQGEEKYVTIDYTSNGSPSAIPRPGVELRGCAPRTEILIHPGRGFLSSVGCINLCTNLPDRSEPITYKSSRRRVISMINDMKSYLGASFPKVNEKKISNAKVVVDSKL